MRSLTATQKATIENYIILHGGKNYNLKDVHKDLLTTMETLNDYETLWQDLERYAGDFISKLYDIEIEKHILRG